MFQFKDQLILDPDFALTCSSSVEVPSVAAMLLATAGPSLASVHALRVVHPLEDHLVPHVGRRQGHRLEVTTIYLLF